MFSAVVPLTKCVLEEIALEGLEGITIEGLWKRLSVRLKLKLPFESKFVENVWTFLRTSNKIQFYVLPTEREPLKIFNRNDFIDPVTGAPNELVSWIFLQSGFRFLFLMFNIYRQHARTMNINLFQSLPIRFADLAKTSMSGRKFNARRSHRWLYKKSRKNGDDNS